MKPPPLLANRTAKLKPNLFFQTLKSSLGFPDFTTSIILPRLVKMCCVHMDGVATHQRGDLTQLHMFSRVLFRPKSAKYFVYRVGDVCLRAG